MFLGPVVAAAQEILDPSPQTSHPWKERNGGGGGGGCYICCDKVFWSLIPRVEVYDYLLRISGKGFYFFSLNRI